MAAKDPFSRKSKKQFYNNFRDLVNQPEVLDLLSSLTDAEIDDPSLNKGLMAILEQTRITQWAEFIRIGLLSFRSQKDSREFKIFDVLIHKYRNSKVYVDPRNHQRKRNVAINLGLLKEPPSIMEFMQRFRDPKTEYYDFDAAAAASLQDTKLGFAIIIRKRVAASVHRGESSILLEKANKSTPGATVASVENGYHIVHETDSVVFISPNGQKDFTIELVVIREVAKNAPFSESLYKWLHSVVETACGHRRDVRPNHPGKLVQFGLNMGPRHARLLGWAKSFTAKLSEQNRYIEDTDALGAVSLFWNVILSIMPKEVIQEILDYLKREKLPNIATRDIPEGPGFTIQFDGEEFHYRTTGRAPPESLAACGYSAPIHTDASLCRWSLSWTVARKEVEGDGGSSYVDVGLRTVVRPAPGTMIAAQPQYPHGTTHHMGSINYGFVIPFTKRLADGYRNMLAKGPKVLAFTPKEKNVDGEDSD